jgi:hypothetical protein
MSSQTLLATIQITPTQQLRVTGSIQDRDHREAIGVDIRKWYAKGGEYFPTPKGIWLNLDQLHKLLAYMLPETDIEGLLNHELLKFLQPGQEAGFQRLS